MYRILIVLMATFMFFSCSTSTSHDSLDSFSMEASKTLTLTTLTYPPFAYMASDGSIKGIDAEILQKAAKRAGINLVIKLVDWEQALNLSKNGIVDGIFILFKTKEREKIYKYIEIPLSFDQMAFFSSNTFKKDIVSIKDLKGLRVGIEKETVYPEEFTNYNDCKKMSASNPKQLISWLATGKVDVAIGSKLPIKYMVKSLKKTQRVEGMYDNIRPLSLILDLNANYVAISKASKEGMKLKNDLTKAIIDLQNTGEIYKIKMKYMMMQK